MLCSVIISNRNELGMMGITLRSAIEALWPLGKDNGEVVICDNSEPKYKGPLKGVIPSGYLRDHRVQVIHQDYPCLFTARETAAHHAKGKYILCLDSHMLCGHNMIVDLVNFMERANNKVGFAHAPIVHAHHHEDRSKHDRDVSTHELGPWGAQHHEECRITWKGMPWICRRDWFLSKEGLGGYGALSQFKLSWGGGDMHIGYKPWLLGFENWAVPTRPGIHIGPYPSLKAAPGNDPFNRYRVYQSSGTSKPCMGFLVSCYVLGGEEMMLRDKAVIQKRFGKCINVERQWGKAISMGKAERAWLQARQTVTFDELLKNPPWHRGNVNLKHQKELAP